MWCLMKGILSYCAEGQRDRAAASGTHGWENRADLLGAYPPHFRSQGSVTVTWLDITPDGISTLTLKAAPDVNVCPVILVCSVPALIRLTALVDTDWP